MKERKNLYLGISGWAILLASALSFTSCADDDIIDSSQLTTGKGICFNIANDNEAWQPDSRTSKAESTTTFHSENPDDGFSITVTTTNGIRSFVNTKPQSRGTQTKEPGNDWSYKVGAYYYANANATPADFFSENTSGGLTFGSEGVGTSSYYWPQNGNISFFAVAPAIENFNVPTAENIDAPTLTYTIPSDVSQQKDIMVAQTAAINTPGTSVGLNFQHLLAGVQFKVGKMQFIKINSLSIEGVQGGTVTMTYNNNQWSYEASESSISYNVIYTANGLPNIDTSGLSSGQYITDNDNNLVMLVMPQALGENQKLKLNYTEMITGEEESAEIVFSGQELAHEWEAGKTTTYVLNIDTDITSVEIPSPPDADAHYVRIDMDYDLTGLSDYTNKGITISNIVASANWLDDGSNTASSDKQAIYIKTTLTDMQAKGFFTDELWELKYSVDDNGNKTYTTGSANGPALVDDNILGSETFNIASMGSGTIYLFLDENNGTTDRNGELKFTATVTQNGNSRTVTLGSGKFRQLAPSWNDDGIGVERFEDEDIYPYGFSYNRVVTYTNNLITKYQNANIFEKLIYLLAIWLFGYSMDAVIPNTEGMADGFVTIDTYEHWAMGTVKESITLDYGALNSVKSITSEDNGLGNTITLYNYTGAVDLTDLENEIDKSLNIPAEDDWTKIESSNSPNPTDYAAFIALTRNRMRELRTVISTSKGNSEVNSIILHKEGEGGTDNKGDESGAVIVEWYLPSYEESLTLKETGTGEETTSISPLNGTYWSSTAGTDPASGTNGYAYSYTYSNNVYSTYNSNEDRTNKLKVRAVRKKPTTTTEQE